MLTGTQSRKYRSGKRHGVDGRRVGATSCFDIVVSGQYDIVYKFYPKHPFNPSSLTFGACILSECLLNDACTTQLAKRLSCATRLRELDLHHNYDWQFHGVGCDCPRIGAAPSQPPGVAELRGYVRLAYCCSCCRGVLTHPVPLIPGLLSLDVEGAKQLALGLRGTASLTSLDLARTEDQTTRVAASMMNIPLDFPSVHRLTVAVQGLVHTGARMANTWTTPVPEVDRYDCRRGHFVYDSTATKCDGS